MPKDLDAAVVKATRSMLTAKGEYYDSFYAGPGHRYYVMVQRSSSGAMFMQSAGLTLFHQEPDHDGFMSLDLTNGDVAENILRRFRESIAHVLEEHGIRFIPASEQALRRIIASRPLADLTLIDRDGFQAVFSYPSNGKRNYYITGYDANESPPLYFLAQLPHKVTSYKDALEALKPKSVKLAESLGLSVLRQGDMFCIPTGYRTADLKTMEATFEDKITREQTIHVVSATDVEVFRRQLRNYSEHVSYSRYSTSFSYGLIRNERYRPQFPSLPKDQPLWIWNDGKAYPIDDEGKIHITEVRKRGLYGTAHTADEMALLPDGTMFARGTVKHDPRNVLGEGRRADHADLKLPGKRWYLVARNTVPVSK